MKKAKPLEVALMAVLSLAAAPEPLLGGSGGAASGQPHRAVAGCCGCYHTIHRSCSVVHWSIKSIPTGRGVRIWYGMAYVSVPSCGPEANVWD